jgi:hypothetical protein
MPTLFVHLDVETTGPTPATADLVAVGATCFRENDLSTVGANFYARIVPDRPLRWNADTKVWWSEQSEEARIATFGGSDSAPRGHSPFEAAMALDAWLADLESEGTPVMVAWPSAFDWMFVACLLDEQLGRNRMGFAPMCVNFSALKCLA